MVAANHALGGVPRDLVQTATGLVVTLDYVDAARARIVDAGLVGRCLAAGGEAVSGRHAEAGNQDRRLLA